MTTEEEIYKIYLEHNAKLIEAGEVSEHDVDFGPVPHLRALSAAIGKVIDQKFADLDVRLNDALHRMQDPNG